MGQIAAQTVVDQIETLGQHVPEIAIEPEFVVRASTGHVPSRGVKVALAETGLSV
jgi:DNA-binding LacI/PurR family transcriptional regulator